MIRLPNIKLTWILFISILGIAVFPSLCGGAPAQDVPQYTVEEYNAYQAITGEPDPAKKMDLIVKFFKTYPKSTLLVHVTGDFQTMLKALQDGKKWPQLITVGKQFLAVSPDDPYTIALIAAAYSETKNYKQFVVFGEESYRTNPSGNLAYAMAKAYQSLGNNAKLVEWAERTVAAIPDNFEMRMELAKIYADSNRPADAEKHAQQCLKAIQAAQKPENASDRDWKTTTDHFQMASYFIMGNSAFQKQSYAAAVTNLENSLKINNRNDTAYYILAQSYLQLRQTNPALKNFAKAALLGGSVAEAAKQNLELYYKQTHRNSLIGIERIYEVAKEELGIK